MLSSAAKKKNRKRRRNMRIYKRPEHEKIMRIRISRHGEKTMRINLHECEQDEVLQMVKSVILQQDIDPFSKGNKTNIEVREFVNGKNGLARSISFHGLSIEQVHKAIINHLNKQHEPRKSTDEHQGHA